jgi:DNA-binding MarR family transcriptional regulator
VYTSLIFEKYKAVFDYLVDKNYVSRLSILEDLNIKTSYCSKALQALSKARLVSLISIENLTPEQRKKFNGTTSVYQINKYMFKIYQEAYRTRTYQVKTQKPPSKDMKEAFKPFTEKIFCSSDYTQHYQVTKQTANAHLQRALKENVIKLINKDEVKHKEAGYKNRNYYICTK